MLLAWLAASFVGGVVVGAAVSPSATLAVAVSAAFLLAALVGRRWRRVSVFVIAAAFCLGVARAPHALRTTGSDLGHFVGQTVRVDAVVDAEPDIRDNGANYVLRVRSVSRVGLSRTVSGRLAVHTARGVVLEYGDRVTVTGRLLPVRTQYFPRGTAGQVRFPRLIDSGPVDTGPLGWVVPLRRYLENGIDAWLPEPEAALLIAIALGAKSASLGDLAPSLVAVGLIHVIAISGIKVAMVAGTVYELALLSRRRTLTLAVTLTVLATYVLLTGATASGERSAIMWALVFVAVYLGRNTVTLVSLGFAAALMVALDPGLPWDIGFQLSTVGTFAIVAFAPPLQRTLRYVPSPFREALAVTIAAQLGTLPIVIGGFNLVSLSGPVCNALVLPLLPILIILGFALGIVSSVPVIAAPVGALAYALLHVSVEFSIWASRLPLDVRVGALPPVLSVLFYLTLLGVAAGVLRKVNFAPLGHHASRAREAILTVSVAMALVTASVFAAPSQPSAQLLWLGSGQSFLLRSDGFCAVIDGSPRPLAFLWRLGRQLRYSVRIIDLVVVTDPKAGNVAALTELLRHYTVREVLDVGVEYPSSGYAAWRAALRARHVPVFALRTGSTATVGRTQISALGPDALYPSPSDSIGLLRISEGRHRLLLLGNSSRREQQESLFRNQSLSADSVYSTGRSPLLPLLVAATHAKHVVRFGAGPSARNATSTSVLPLFGPP